MMALLLLGLTACHPRAPGAPPLLDAVGESTTAEAPLRAEREATDVVRRWSQIPPEQAQRAVEGWLARQPLPAELGGGVALVIRLDDGALIAVDAKLDDPAWSALEGRRVRVDGLLRPGFGDSFSEAPLLSLPSTPVIADGRAELSQPLYLAEGPLDAAAALLAEVYQRPLLVFGEAALPAMSLPPNLAPTQAFSELAAAAGMHTGDHGPLLWLAPEGAAERLAKLDGAPLDGSIARLDASRLEARDAAQRLAASLDTRLVQVPSGWLLAGGALPARASLEVLAKAAGGALSEKDAGLSLGGGALPPMQGATRCEDSEGAPCCAPLVDLKLLGTAPGPRGRALVSTVGHDTDIVGLGDPVGCPSLRPSDALQEHWIVEEITAEELVLRFASTGREWRMALGG